MAIIFSLSAFEVSLFFSLSKNVETEGKRAEAFQAILPLTANSEKIRSFDKNKHLPPNPLKDEK